MSTAPVQQTPFTAQEPSATGLQDRTVEDAIRHLLPAESPLLSLVATGTVQDGEMKSSSGMISKMATQTPRFEYFTHTSPEISKVAGAVSSLTVTFSDVLDVYLRMIFLNTANNTVGVVDAISSNDVTFVSLGAGDTFSVTEGDTLLQIGHAYEEYSSDPAYMQNADDNHYNLIQEFRYPTAISNTQKATKQLAGGNFFERMHRYTFIRAKREIERALLFGKRSASGNKTSLTQVGASVTTTEGLWHMAANSYSAGGNFTPTKLYKDIPDEYSNTISDSDRVIIFTSKEARSMMLEWPQASVRTMQDKNPDIINIKAHKFRTGGADVEIMSHDAFNVAGMKNKGLLFVPERLQYRYLAGWDLKPNKGIQSNSTDGTIDEFAGKVGIGYDDGGEAILKLENLF
jgi:hypothetical protein